FERPTTIINRGETCRVPPGDGPCEVHDPLLPAYAGSLSNRREGTVFCKCGDVRRITATLRRNVDHTAHGIRRPHHALTPPENLNPLDVVSGQISKIVTPECSIVDDCPIN